MHFLELQDSKFKKSRWKQGFYFFTKKLTLDTKKREILL